MFNTRITISSLVWITLICGVASNIIENRIIGGELADIEDFPYQVSITIYGFHVCGGSLISSRHIVTAAHCTTELVGRERYIGVNYGTTDIHRNTDRLVKKITLHNYNPENFDNDIAILEVTEPIPFSSKVQPIKLPKKTSIIPTGTLGRVSGWGIIANESSGVSATSLQYVEVPKIDESVCREIYDKLTENMACYGYVNIGGKDACQGDSGGPLEINGELHGIISWGTGCARASSPGVYTKVQNYIDWIRSKISK